MSRRADEVVPGDSEKRRRREKKERKRRAKGGGEAVLGSWGKELGRYLLTRRVANHASSLGELQYCLLPSTTIAQAGSREAIDRLCTYRQSPNEATYGL